MTYGWARWFVAVALITGVLPSAHALDDDEGPHQRAVKVVAKQQLTVKTPAGGGSLPLYTSADWTKPLPDITKAVIVFHGRLRDADVYFRSAQTALSAAGKAGSGTLLIVPQFLTPADVAAHKLPDATLRWEPTGWMGGEPAVGPAGLSSFDAIDAIVAHLADRSLFPNLKQIVIAGHSGGGQVVQRYAVVGQGEAALRRGSIHVRYVVANPSSYAYFTADRPKADGTLAPFAAASCAGFNRWKYGMDARPTYAAKRSPQDLEKDYVHRDVIYLIGDKDTNPKHPALDKSCEAEAQGPHRFARGHAYFNYIKSRHKSGFHQHIYDIPGVGHSGSKMLTSACGLVALFGTGKCS